MLKYWLLSGLFFVVTVVNAQRLNPGFNLQEYQEMLRVNAHIYEQDGTDPSDIPAPQFSKLIYRSSTMGLNNLYEFWQRDEHIKKG